MTEHEPPQVLVTTQGQCDLNATSNHAARCGELSTGMTEREPFRVWVTCTCGARIERDADPPT